MLNMRSISVCLHGNGGCRLRSEAQQWRYLVAFRPKLGRELLKASDQGLLGARELQNPRGAGSVQRQ